MLIYLDIWKALDTYFGILAVLFFSKGTNSIKEKLAKVNSGPGIGLGLKFTGRRQGKLKPKGAWPFNRLLARKNRWLLLRKQAWKHISRKAWVFWKGLYHWKGPYLAFRPGSWWWSHLVGPNWRIPGEFWKKVMARNKASVIQRLVIIGKIIYPWLKTSEFPIGLIAMNLSHQNSVWTSK